MKLKNGNRYTINLNKWRLYKVEIEELQYYHTVRLLSENRPTCYRFLSDSKKAQQFASHFEIVNQMVESGKKQFYEVVNAHIHTLALKDEIGQLFTNFLRKIEYNFLLNSALICAWFFRWNF